MRNIEVIDQSLIKMQTEEKLRKGFLPKQSEIVSMVRPFIKDREDSEALFSDMEKAVKIGSDFVSMSEKIIKYGGAMYVPRVNHTASKKAGKKIEMSAYEMLQRGYFDPTMSGNTLPVDWNNLWDALRVDISIRVAAQPTVRENFFNILNNPGASKTINVTELYPYAFEFVLNNGEGQSVNQGESRAGANEALTHYLYATGFTRTLIDELYNNSFDAQKVSDGVAIAYNAKRDDLSISTILNFAFSGVSGSQTPADATSGASRQELLFNTIENGIDQLARRYDPVSKKFIQTTDLSILCASEDSRHIQRIVSGLPSGAESKILPPISNISSIVAYDTTTIPGRVKDVVYTGVTRGKCYLVKKNRYMNVSVKRSLQMESDMRPDVTTLARERQSWYFAEGQQTTGIQYFIQELTLPAYTPA